MAQGSAFPAFISVELDPASNGFREFKESAFAAGATVKRQFEADMADVQRIIRNALTLPPNANGGLNIDTASMRQAANEAQRTAQATREFARAAEEAARANGDNSEETRRYVVAAQAAAREAEDHARALNMQANSYEKLQVVIDRAGTELTGFAGANQRVASSQREISQASVQAGQQVQDLFVQIQGGQRVSTALAQQIPQLTYAFTNLGGRVGAVARVLSGPWGLAVAGAAYGLGTLIDELIGADDAAKGAEFSTYALGDAQSVLGTVIDLVTGKIKNQSAALQGLAQAQLLVAKVEAQTRLADARRGVTAIQDRGLIFDGGFGGGINIRRRQRDGRDVISQQVLSGEIATKSAVEKLEQLRRIGRLTDEEFTAAATSVANLGLELENIKVLDSANRLLNGEANAGDLNLLLKPTKPKKARSGSTSEKERREAERLQASIDSAVESVAQLREQFDEAPRDIDRANRAARELDATLKEVQARLAGKNLTKDQREKLLQAERDIKDAQSRILPNFRQRPVDNRIKDFDKELQLQRLLLDGREDEVDLLAFKQDLMRQLNVDTEEQLQAELRGRNISKEKLDLLMKQVEQVRENERVLARMDRSVRSTRSQIDELWRTYGTIEQSIAQLPDDARGALKDFAASIRQQVNDIIARRIADNLFGDLFVRLEKDIRGKRPIDRATEGYVASTTRASTALIDLTNTFIYAAGAFRGAANDNLLSIAKGSNMAEQAIKAATKSPGAAYDPNAEIVVTADRPRKADREQREAVDAMAASAKSLKELARQAAEGAFIGQSASSLIFGSKGSSLGSAIGGALGGTLGEKFLGKGLETIAKGLGDFAGPLGSIAGGLLGGALGSLFSKTPRGFATIGGGADGKLAITGTGGNSKSAIRAGNEAAGATLDTLDKVAQALGGTYDASRGSVSIGRSGDSWHVDTSGRGRLKKSQGGFDFDDDYEAAVRFATMDLIKDGVIAGLRASTQRLLQQGKDIDAALQKALDFESVFARLKEYDDPVGAALDTLDKEFSRLKTIFAEAGASAAEYAELERLYGIERADAIKEAAERLTSGLQSLYDDLTIGDNGRSLRDRLAAAQSAYDPLKQRVLAGDKTAYDDFAEAARSLLDIRREFSGSQTPYFNLLDEITAITNERIEAEKNVVALAESRDSPFGSNGKATGANDNAAVVGAIDRQTEVLTAGFRALLTASGGFSGGGGFSTNPFL